MCYYNNLKRMKLALILFGISLKINRYLQYDTLYSVDYNNSYDNYQRYIVYYNLIKIYLYILFFNFITALYSDTVIRLPLCFICSFLELGILYTRLNLPRTSFVLNFEDFA